MNTVRTFFNGLFHFRNTNHEMWFYLTMALLLIFSIFAITRGKKKELEQFGVGMCCVGIFAFIKVVVLKQPSEGFSIDCTWYNPLVGIIALIIARFIKNT